MKHPTPKLPILFALFALLTLTSALSHVWDKPLPKRGIQSVTLHPMPLLAPDHAVKPPEVVVEPPPVIPGAESQVYEEPEAKAPIVQVPKAREPNVVPGSGRIALIIDDCGISRRQTEPVFALPVKVTMSFLPYGRATPALAEKASEEGHEVMLHMPMQPEGHANPGPDPITVGLSTADINQRLDAALALVPQAVGVNNHMGSAATADARVMQDFMAALKPAHKFFVDSYTGPHSVAYAMAQDADIPTLRRNVFLDNDPSLAAIEHQLDIAERTAKSHGYAVVIGHPYNSTLRALHAWLPLLESRGVRIVKVQDLLTKSKTVLQITPE